jgi:hypothetical protein
MLSPKKLEIKKCENYQSATPTQTPQTNKNSNIKTNKQRNQGKNHRMS